MFRVRRCSCNVVKSLPAGCADHICCRPFEMPGAHCESEDKENAPRNVRPTTPAKKFEQKDSENETLRRENEELRSELEKLRNEKLAAAETVRAAAISESEWQPTDHKSIGQLVRRFFDCHPSADGVVTKWRPATEDGAVQFRVVHDDDGDEEDLDEEELEAAIAAHAFGPFDLGLSVNPPSAIIVQFPFATSRRSSAIKLLPCTATLCESATERVGEYVLLYGKQHGHAPERRLVVFCTCGQLWDEQLGQCLEWQMTPAPAPAPVPGTNKAKPARRRAPPKDPDFVEEKVRAPNPSPGSGPDPEALNPTLTLAGGSVRGAAAARAELPHAREAGHASRRCRRRAEQRRRRRGRRW